MRTCYGAEAPTSRVFPRDTFSAASPLDTSFDRLISDPLDALTDLADAAQEWVDGNWSTRRPRPAGTANGTGYADARAQADADADEARQEVNWVRAGVKELAADQDLLEAFRQAMRTMQVIGARKNYTALHLFQAAWITGCLPAVKDPSSDPNVDILWFATGGGKSEAYLGLMLVTLFYARRTGTTAGAWCGRGSRSGCCPCSRPSGSGRCSPPPSRSGWPTRLTAAGEPFAVGYFVGSGNTPNKFAGRNSPCATADPTSRAGAGRLPRPGLLPHLRRPRRSRSPRPADRRRRRAYRRRGHIRPRCGRPSPGPAAGGAWTMNFDEPSWTMQHVCTSPGCPAAGALDVYVIDDDIYRRTPSVLVGTVDKLAQLGMQKQFATLLGRAASRCPQHGLHRRPPVVRRLRLPDPRRRPRARQGRAGRAATGDRRRDAPAGRGARRARRPVRDAARRHQRGDEEPADAHRRRDRHPGGLPGTGPAPVPAARAPVPGQRADRRRELLGLHRRRPAAAPLPGPAAPPHRLHHRHDRDRPHPPQMARRSWPSGPEMLLAEAGLPADEAHLAVAREAAEDLYEVFLAYALRNDDLGQFMREERLRDFHALGNWAQVNGDADPGQYPRLRQAPGQPGQLSRPTSGSRRSSRRRRSGTASTSPASA